MFSRLSTFALFLSTLTSISASPLFEPTPEGLSKRQFVLPVEFDGFYKAPSNLASLKPGDIVRTRKVDISIAAIAKLDVDATQIYYRTTSQNGSAIGTVTTVLKPKNALTDRLATYLVAEDSVALKCAPSYSLRSGASPESAIVVFDSLLAARLVGEGWIVNIPDYEGPNSAFAVGRLSGRAAIDGARAALNFKEIKWSAKPKLTFNGYSGGGIAAGWVAAVLSSYAPELNVVGISTGGTPANVSQTLEYVDGGLFAGFGLQGVVGLVNAYQEFGPLYDKLATPAGVQAFKTGRSMCSIGNVLAFAFSKFKGPELQTLGDKILYQPTVNKIVSENVLGAVKSETPKVPVLAYHAVADEIIPIAGSDYMVKQWCANGAKQVQYYRIPAPAEHVVLVLTAQSYVLQFLRDRFDGKPWISQCSTKNAVLPDVPLTLSPAVSPLYDTAKKLLDDTIGEDDGKLKATLTKQSGH